MKSFRTPFFIVLVLTLFFSSQTWAQSLVCSQCVPGAAIVNDGINATQIDETANYSFATLSGKQKRNTSAIDDDDCSGEQGTWWYDTTDSQFEVCNANSGTPIALTTGGGGSITAVGPGCSTGACLTNGVTTAGTVLLNWEGTAADANDFTLNVPANPGSTISWTVPDSATALTFPSGTDTVVGRAVTETLTNKTLSVGGTTTEGTGFLNFTAVGAGTCGAGEYWVQASSGTSALSFCDNGTLRVLTDLQRFSHTLYSGGPAPWEWTNQPSAATFMYGSARHVTALDTTGFTAARMTTNVEVAGDGSSQLALQYKTSACTTLSGYADAGSTAITTAMSSAGVITSSWQTLVAGAKAATVCFAAVGTAAASAGDPQIGSVVIEFR